MMTEDYKIKLTELSTKKSTEFTITKEGLEDEETLKAGISLALKNIKENRFLCNNSNNFEE